MVPCLPTAGSSVTFTSTSPLTSQSIQCMLVVPPCLLKQGSPLTSSKQSAAGHLMPSKFTSIVIQSYSLLLFTAVPPIIVDCILVHPIIPHFHVLCFYFFLYFYYSLFQIVSLPNCMPTYIPSSQTDSTLSGSLFFSFCPTFPYYSLLQCFPQNTSFSRLLLLISGQGHDSLIIHVTLPTFSVWQLVKFKCLFTVAP